MCPLPSAHIKVLLIRYAVQLVPSVINVIILVNSYDREGENALIKIYFYVVLKIADNSS